MLEYANVYTDGQWDGNFDTIFYLEHGYLPNFEECESTLEQMLFVW